MISVLRKSTVRPCPSVRRPSSSTCSSTLKTSGCAFSISSKRIDLIGPAAHRLGQRAALLVADIAGRRADQPGDGVLLHVFRHVDADHRRLVVEQDSRRAPWSARSCRRRSGPRNMNEPIGRFGSCRPARARRTAVDTACTASPWPTTRLPSSSSMRSSLSRSPSSILSTGMPVQRETTCAMCSGVTASSTRPPAARPAASASRELLLELRDDAIGELAGLGEVAACAAPCSSSMRAWSSCSLSFEAAPSFSFSACQRAVSAPDSLLEVGELASRAAASRSLRGVVGLLLQRLALDLELDDAAVELVERLGLGIDLHAQPRGGLVHQVDRLVGQEAVGDVAVARASRRRRCAESVMRTP